MAMYRCAACGSDKVVAGTVKDGYSFKKGVLGVAVFGAVGAVAGLDGKKHESYKCMACGMELAQPMDQETKMAIDDCVNYVEMRQMHNWSMLKYRYPNIESGNADKVLRDRASSLQACTARVIKEEKEKIERFKAMSDEEINAEQAIWLEKANAVHDIFLERNRQAIREWEDGLGEREAAAKAAHDKAVTEANAKMEAAEKEKEQLRIELAGIKGLFTGKKKAALREAMDKKYDEIKALQEKIDKLNTRFQSDTTEERPEEATDRSPIPKEMFMEFGLGPSPRWFRNNSDKGGLPHFVSWFTVNEIYQCQVIYRIIDEYGGRVREKEYKAIIREQLNSAYTDEFNPFKTAKMCSQYVDLTTALKRPLLKEVESVKGEDCDYDIGMGRNLRCRIYYSVEA